MNVKNALVSSLVCVSLLIPAATMSADNAGKIGIVIECESVSKLIADINSLSQALDLKLQSAKTELALSQMFSSPGLAGVNSNKPFQACMILEKPDPASAQPAPKGPEKSFVFVIPVTGDGTTYMASVGKCFGKSEKVNTLTHFSLPAAGKPSREPNLYVGISGDKAFVGLDAVNVATVVSGQNSIASWKTDFTAVAGTIRVGINIPAVLPPLEAMMNRTTEMLKQMPLPPGDMPPMGNPANMLSAEGDLLFAIMKQIKSYTIGIGIKGKSLEINTLLAPAQNSPLAGMTKIMPPTSEKYVSAMPANAFISMAGSGMNIIDLFIEPYSVMMEKISEAAGADGIKAGARMKEIVLSMKGCFAGDYAMGVVSGATPKDLALIQMVSVNDPVKFRKVFLDGLASANSMYANLMPGMTMTVGKSRTSGGCEVIPYSMSYTPPANAMNVPAMPAGGLFQNYKAEMAIAGKDMIFTMGGGTEIMDAAIARHKTGGAKVQSSKAFSSLFPAISAKMTGVYSIELVKMLKAYLSSVPNGEQMLQMIPDTNSGIAGFSTLVGSDIFSVTRIGLDELAGIKSGVPALGLLLMPAIMGGNNPQAATPQGSTEARCVNNLRMLDAAKEQCTLERGLKAGDTVNQAWITKYLLRAKMPVCPAGGTYILNPVGKEPACSVPAHFLK